MLEGDTELNEALPDERLDRVWTNVEPELQVEVADE